MTFFLRQHRPRRRHAAAGDLRALWLYIVAPLAGAALGALIYQFIRGEVMQPLESGLSPDAQRDATREKERV
jgi:hypothetical protein